MADNFFRICLGFEPRSPGSPGPLTTTPKPLPISHMKIYNYTGRKVMFLRIIIVHYDTYIYDMYICYIYVKMRFSCKID